MLRRLIGLFGVIVLASLTLASAVDGGLDPEFYNMDEYGCFYRVLNEALIVKTTDFAFVCTEAVNKIFDISENYREQGGLCSIYSPSQSLDKISRHLDEDQKIRFFNAIKRESTTQGVVKFSPEDLETLSESAKSLSFGKYTVVIVGEEAEKEKVHSNERIRTLTPKEFIELVGKAWDLYEVLMPLAEGGIDYLDCIMLVFFKEGIYERVKSIMGNNLSKE